MLPAVAFLREKQAISDRARHRESLHRGYRRVSLLRRVSFHRGSCRRMSRVRNRHESYSLCLSYHG
jgi:hypothetical protein